MQAKSSWNEGLLSVMKDRSAFVQEQIYTELDAAFDYPAEGAVIMVYSVVHEERIVKSIRINGQAER